ncbi:Peregrin [Cryptotermes secundus]|uniref:Peregrin n=2 Tax=Cryptotermes secundus TaxID=105785 RepID=A0A2J7PX48_9NEOP|nr:bromodomain-containing protein 1 isoform X1 [Cryptotermes secundus]PNF20915.1 Peregrin [Cryptotermes secundus]
MNDKMGLDFDVLEFCRKLRNSKQPPYECPVAQCGKVYKSLCGLQYHLVNFDHNAPTPVNPVAAPGRKKGRGSHHSRTPTSTADLLTLPTREGLTYAEAQKMVEFEVDGRVTRVSIFDPLPLISKEEFEATYGSSNDSHIGNQSSADLHQSILASDEKVRLPEPSYTVLDSYNISDAPPRPNAYIRFIERSAEELDGEVEYDMDEEDCAWLNIINEQRAASGLSDVPVDTFELLMDRLEKESYFQSCGKGGDGAAPTVIDDDAVCCICMDGECQNSNVILFCDMCNLAVHQDCYGVPYIPEGQWLCRRCLQSPSRAVDCVLCPNNGGAFKQTDRGHWAHVVCALWIPEVRFANTVFLEPIDSIETIPPARWKLTCYICKQRGVGACIQCHKTNCYAAFHVTCAQQAGLFMKMDTVRDSHGGTGLDPGSVLVQKTAYCDAHTPGGLVDPDSRPRGSAPSASKQGTTPSGTGGAGETAREESRQKMKKARRLLAKKRSSVPVISIPTIPPDRIQEIASLVNVPKKSQLIQRLIAYWTLKRQFRNGVPLLRRLQSSHLARRDDPRPLQEVVSDTGELYRQLKYWQCLRQDLERARLLCELVRKREKLKKELCKVKELWMEVHLQPFVCFLRRLLDLVQSRDTGDIFSEPVDLSEVPDYSDVVTQPMDISTMRTKLENFQYSNLDAFEKDFNLMISNCMAYNSRDTIFYRAAIKMRDQGGALIRQARRDLEANGFDLTTGLLLPDGVTCAAQSCSSLSGTDSKSSHIPTPQLQQPSPQSLQSGVPQQQNLQASQQQHRQQPEEGLAGEIDRELATILDKNRLVASADRLSKLLELLDRSQGLRHGLARAKRVRLIKTEITKLRRRMALGGNGPQLHHPQSEAEDGFESDSEREESSEEEEDMEKLQLQQRPAKPISRHSTRRSSQQQQMSEDTGTSVVTSGTKEQEAEVKTTDTNVTSPINAVQSSGKQKSGRGRKKIGGKRQADEGTDSVISSKVASSTTPNTQNLNSAAGVSGPHSSLDPSMRDSSGGTVPATTPVKLTASSEQTHSGTVSQLTSVSPSGVNRRTAVLFTRKAAAAASAIKKPDTHSGAHGGTNSSASMSSSSSLISSRRRVGRPRKNLDALMNQCSVSTSNVEPNLHLSGTGDGDHASMLMPAPPLPCSESFTVYRRGGGDIPAETDEETQSDSTCSSCSTSEGSTGSSEDGSSSIDLQQRAVSGGESSGEEEGASSGSLEPLDLVWAKCRGYPWYPALIINPKMPRAGYLHNGVPIPAPPADVLALASNYEEPVYLVLFFDTKRTWQWLPRNKLEPLGIATEVDQAKLTESRKPADRKAVRKAYQEAMLHRCQVSGGQGKRSRAASIGNADLPVPTDEN